MKELEKLTAITKKYKLIYTEPPVNYYQALTPILLHPKMRAIFKELIASNIITKILPEFMLCIHLDQRTAWHSYTVDEHSFKSVEFISKHKRLDLKTKELLAWTMLLHDIGKPIALARCLTNNLGYHFFNHAKDSAEIAKNRLPHMGVTEKESSLIYLLIENHDLFMHLSESISEAEPQPTHKKAITYHLIEQFIKKMEGMQNFELLMLVYEADTYAKGKYALEKNIPVLSKIQTICDKIKKM